ncbi:MAG: plastocyanin/azurin family copper-binding protein [Acidimicrobiales bacterium]
MTSPERFETQSRRGRSIGRVLAGGLGLALGLAAMAAGVAGAAETHSMDIVDFTYGDGTLSVSAGSTVTWTNRDEARHSVTSTTGGELGSPLFRQGETFTHTFASPGTFAYFCEIHPEMKATVTVTPVVAVVPAPAPSHSIAAPEVAGEGLAVGGLVVPGVVEFGGIGTGQFGGGVGPVGGGSIVPGSPVEAVTAPTPAVATFSDTTLDPLLIVFALCAVISVAATVGVVAGRDPHSQAPGS